MFSERIARQAREGLPGIFMVGSRTGQERAVFDGEGAKGVGVRGEGIGRLMS